MSPQVRCLSPASRNEAARRSCAHCALASSRPTIEI